MTHWKDNHEKRTPFLSRGTQRIAAVEDRTDDIEQRLSQLEQISATAVQVVETLPADADEHPDTLYLVIHPDH
jgi:hypothetical protein